MSEQRLPRKAESRTLELDLWGSLLGFSILSLTALGIGLGIVSFRDHLRLRRQRALLEGLMEVVQLLTGPKGELLAPGSKAKGG